MNQYITTTQSNNETNITIPAGANISEMITIPYQTTDATAQQPRSWKATIKKDSRVTLFESDIQSSEIIVESGAELNLIAFQLSQPSQLEHVTKHIALHEGARARLFFAIFDSITLQMNGDLVGARSDYENRIVYFGNTKQAISLNTHAEHSGKETLSRTLIRGVALDQAHIRFEGSIVITESGSTNGSSLEHEGLLMSKKARIDALPGLEVATNDVKAAHSSAIHYIRPEQLFYLQTRGIDPTQAKKLILTGFLEEIINTLPVEADALRTLVLDAIMTKQQSLEL